MSNSHGRAAPVLISLFVGILAAAANVLLYLYSVQSLALEAIANSPVETVWNALRARPIEAGQFAAIPIAACLLVLIAMLVGRSRDTHFEAAPAESKAPIKDGSAEDAVLGLLGALQKEGRFIDFLQEDLNAYEDAQIGAAIRPIHEGCRQVVRERINIERIYESDEGSEVLVEKGFDPASVRLTGDVHGEPPFRGTLQHGGWKASSVELPKISAELNTSILEPAEIELQRASSPDR